MDGAFRFGFALFVCAAAAVLLVAHVRSWRRFRRRTEHGKDYEYYRVRHRRRLQTSGMLGLLGIMLLVGHWVDSPPLPRWVTIVYWGFALLLVVWVGLLALLDILATRLHFARARQDVLVERARLESQLRRLQQRKGNGRPESEADAPHDRG